MKPTNTGRAQYPSKGLCRVVVSLKDPALRGAFVRSELLRSEPEIFASILNDLCAAAEQADAMAREVLGAVLPVLADPELEPRIRELQDVAEQRALLSLGRLLRGRRAIQDAGPLEPQNHEVITGRGGRPLTLGERRALARNPSRSFFDKLLRDPHPLVIQNLLANPRLTEEDVLRMVAFRPGRAEVMVEIAKNPKWAQRRRIRLAIVMNPGSPPEVSVPMIGLLIRPELEQVATSPSVPALLRAAAVELLARRPPWPDKEDSEIQ